MEIDARDLARCAEEIDDAFDLLESGEVMLQGVLGKMSPTAFMTQLIALKKSIPELERAVCAERLCEDPDTKQRLVKAPGSQILRLLERGCGITGKDHERLTSTIQTAQQVLAYSHDSSSTGGLHLEKLEKLLAVIFRSAPEDLDRHYQFLIYENGQEERKGTKRKSPDWSGGDRSAQAPRTLCLAALTAYPMTIAALRLSSTAPVPRSRSSGGKRRRLVASMWPRVSASRALPLNNDVPEVGDPLRPVR